MSWKASGSITSKVQVYHHWTKVKEKSSWSVTKAFYQLRNYIKSQKVKTRQKVKFTTAKNSVSVNSERNR